MYVSHNDTGVFFVVIGVEVGGFVMVGNVVTVGAWGRILGDWE